MHTKRLISHLTNVICLLYIISAAVIFAYAASFSVFSGDDFTIVRYEHAARGGGLFAHIASGLRFIAQEYFTWQGTYFHSFLYACFNPLDGGGMHQLRTVMVLNALLFIAAILVLAYVAVCRIGGYGKTPFLICAALLLFALLNAFYYTEAFTWFTGSMNYGIPFSTGITGFALYLLQTRTHLKRHIIPAAVLCFLAVGATTSVAGTLCFAMLLVLTYRRLADGSFDRGTVIAFAAAFAGALINVAAPGNYRRYDLTETILHEGFDAVQQTADVAHYSLNPLTAVLKTVMRYLVRCDYLLSGTVLGLVLLGMLIAGFCLRKEADRRLILWSATGLITPMVTLFPFYLGSPYTTAWIPDRVDFIFDTSAVCAACFLFFQLGGALADAAKGISREFVLWMLGLLLFTAVFANRLNAFDLVQYDVAKAAFGGEMRAYHDGCAAVHTLLENSPGEDVVADLPVPVPYLCPFNSVGDPEEWKNRCIADYYGCKSFRGIIPGE